MQSIQIGTTVAEIHMQSGEKHWQHEKCINGLTIYPSELRFLQNWKNISATVIEFRFFSRIKKKITLMNISHILHHIASNYTVKIQG